MAEHPAEQARTSLDVTARDRFECFIRGHDVHSWGTILGFCRRCQHGVHTADHKHVLYYGEFHRYPPKHRDDEPSGERRLSTKGRP